MSGLLMGRAFYFDLPPRQKLLLLAIADHANDDGYGAHPGQERLARKVACSVRQVRRLLAELESANLVQVVEHGNGVQHTSRYFLPWAEDKADISAPKADVQVSAKPSLEPSDLSVLPSDLSDQTPERASASFSGRTAPPLERFYSSSNKRDEVAALIDIGRLHDKELSGARLGAMLKAHPKTAVMEALMTAIARNVAGIEDYMEGVLRSGRANQAGQRTAGPRPVVTLADLERSRLPPEQGGF